MSTNGGAGSSGGNGELERRERQWLAEKATLEEYYEVSARNQRDAELQAREAADGLRRENDAQLQLLQAARRALSDLRNRFDLAAASWNDERLRLQTAAEPVSGDSRPLDLPLSVCASIAVSQLHSTGL